MQRNIQSSCCSTGNITTFTQCAIELVVNSLNAQATSIAVRIDNENRKIVVVDNGIGMLKAKLEHIHKYDENGVSEVKNMMNAWIFDKSALTNIHRLSAVLSITSRQQNCKETYSKVFKADCKPTLIETEYRPSCGTTVTVENFFKLPITYNEREVTLICFFIASIALVNPMVSFSIRDEEHAKMLLRISKPHKSEKVLSILFGAEISTNLVWFINNFSGTGLTYRGYIGLVNAETIAVKQIFVNYRPVHSPVLLEWITRFFIEISCFHKGAGKSNVTDKGNLFILLFVTCNSDEYTLSVDDGKVNIMFHRIHDLLSDVKKSIINTMARDTFLCKSIPQDGVVDADKYDYTEKRIARSDLTGFSNEDKNAKPLNLNKSIIPKKKNNLMRRDIQNFVRSQPSIQKKFYLNMKNNRNLLDFINFMDHNNFMIDSKFHRIWKELIKPKLLNTGELLGQTKCNNTISSITESVNHVNSALMTNTMLTVSQGNKSEEEETESRVAFSNIDDLHITVTESKDNNCFVEDVETINNDNREITPYNCTMSEWSDWCYHNTNSYKAEAENFKQFEFLPKMLRKNMLLCKNIRLKNLDGLTCSNISWNLQDDIGQQDKDVRLCALSQPFYEFTLKKETLNCVRILNQVNNEFIAALTIQDNREVLLLMDQHAVHERIRYENLIDYYRSDDKKGFLSDYLKIPMIIEFNANVCSLLVSNKALMKKFGLQIRALNDSSLSVEKIPKCFMKSNKYYYDALKIKSFVFNLLNELAEKLDSQQIVNNLPTTINNVIAMEACRGAMKFGDRLDINQCMSLVNLLKRTKCPMRCAHGRPSIVPMVDVSELTTKRKTTKERLNFASLKKLRIKKLKTDGNQS